MRWLMAITPSRTEHSFANRHKMAGYPDDTWFEVHDENRVAYIKVGESGRYSRTRPLDVPGDQFIRIVYDPGPHFMLRRFVQRMVEKLPDTEPDKPGLLAGVDVSYASGDGRFEESERRALMCSCADVHHRREDVTAHLTAYMEALRARFINFQVPGYFLGHTAVLEAVLRGRPALAVVALESIDGAAMSIHSMSDVVATVLKAIVGKEPGGLQIVADGLEDVADRGETLLKSSLKARSVGEYYGRLFEACPVLYSAFLCYGNLADAVPDADGRELYRHRANVTEEFMIRAHTSLGVFAEVYAGVGHLMTYCKRIADLRRTQGAAAAETLANQLIYLEFLFPPSWKPFLLGESNDLPMRF